MVAVRIVALMALLLATPAFAEGWRVESVSGDVVSVKGSADPEPLSVGDVVDDGASIVSDQSASIQLSRRGDVVSLKAESIIVMHPGTGSTRASIEAKSGEVEIDSGSSPEGTFEVRTRYFTIEATKASFLVTARKEFAMVDVDSGQVQVNDPRRSGGPFLVSRGDQFREEPKAVAKPEDEAKAKAAAKAAEAKKAEQEAEAIAKKLDELDPKKKKGKQSKKDSELAKKLAKRGAGAAKDGLDALADEYDADDTTPEVPKIGILTFLFGAGAPSLGIVLGGMAVLFLGLGYLTSAVLGSAGFGMFGNAAILLVGALIGAGFHDLAFSPAFFWDYEPSPGILTTVFFGLASLIGACFGRKYLEERMDQAAAAAPIKKAVRTPARFGTGRTAS